MADLLGITSLPDLKAFDPVNESSGSNASQAAEVMKAAVMVQNMVSQMSAMLTGASSSVSSTAAASAVFSALAAKAAVGATVSFI
ncbi:MAG: hypothetical protein OEL53_17630 [Rhodospirillales bacterium]|nr:hypothetical protein [Rhodospirillales bacterium]